MSPQYRTPEKQQITQFGDNILKPYSSDPAAQADIKSVVADYQLQRQAENLIPGYSGDWSAADKLRCAPPTVGVSDRGGIDERSATRVLIDMAQWNSQ